MKEKTRCCLLFLLLACLLNNINAQENFKPINSFGFKQGLNISNVSFDPLINQSVLLGYTGGIVYRYVSERHMGIQFELNYTQKGWKEKPDSSYNYSRYLNYLEFPFLSHFEYGGNSSKFKLYLGPAISYLINENEITNINWKRQKYYLKKINNPFEFALIVGMGFIKASPIGNFEMDVRYTYGLNSIYNNGQGAIFASAENKVWTINVTYFFKN